MTDDLILQQFDVLRTQLAEQHARLRRDMGHGFDGMQTELRVQNGRVAALEARATAIEERAIPVSRTVYGLIGLMLVGVLASVLNLVLK